MLSLLTKQRKILLAITVVVFIISATLITQTYFTMQIFNHANTICDSVKPGMTRDELTRHAQNNRTTISYRRTGDTGREASLGFSNTAEDSCGCTITLSNDRVTEVSQTFCKSP
jgi:hypothetical protein